MKLRVLSDLHIEFMSFEPPAAQADVIVLAGDILPEHYGLRWARETFPNTPIVYVAGNHEFYDAHYETVLDRCRSEAAELGVHFLERDSVVIDGVRFLGTTLWTDFEVELSRGFPAELAMRVADQRINDFRLILYRDGLLHAETTRQFHLESRRWLEEELARPFDGKTVVVTHHLPHRASIHPMFHGDVLNAAFASHLPHLVRPPVDLWIHGHTHCSCDYDVFGMRVVCNPRGYGPADFNKDFNPTLVVEI